MAKKVPLNHKFFQYFETALFNALLPILTAYTYWQ